MGSSSDAGACLRLRNKWASSGGRAEADGVTRGPAPAPARSAGACSGSGRLTRCWRWCSHHGAAAASGAGGSPQFWAGVSKLYASNCGLARLEGVEQLTGILYLYLNDCALCEQELLRLRGEGGAGLPVGARGCC